MEDAMQTLLVGGAAPAPEFLRARRDTGRSQWDASHLPTRKTEAWKYTSLHPLQRTFAAPEPSSASLQQLGLSAPDFGGSRLVFVDGFLRDDLSTLAHPAAVDLVRFADASPAQGERIAEHLGSAVNNAQHLFANLNDATLADGVFLQVEPDAVVDAPIHLLYFTSNCQPAYSVNQRLLVVLGSNARATLVEHFTGTAAAAFTNGITELVLGDGAHLSHHRLHLEEAGAMHIGGVHARLERNSNLDSFHLALGSELKRIDVVINHQGPGAHCNLNGIYLLRGREHVDYHTCIEHASPHCTSDEIFRGIIGDEASAVFNGRIHIHPDAQKTRAELSNKNLLTSASAQVNTKPELEIYADDVQCAHGATVAALDPGMMHYLRTRGIHRDEAEVMLSYGFINELVESLQLASLQDFLRPLLAARFSRDPRLTRHLL